jgi:hypothetical protein
LLAAEGCRPGGCSCRWRAAAWEFAGSGHIDAALIAVTVAAWLRPGDRGLWRRALLAARADQILSGGSAAGALSHRGWAMPVAFAGATVLVYLPLVALGWRLAIYPVIPAKAGSMTGTGFYLLGLVRQVPLLGGLAGGYMVAATTILASAPLFSTSATP